MLLEALLAVTTLLPRAEAGLAAARTQAAALSPPRLERPAPTPEPPAFSAVARAVSNWRSEAGESLLPASLAFVVRHAAEDPGFVARCVKLNNYWCIKRAGWTGEIGGDSENHTAFAGAAEGADAAAQLLRRYYRAFGRRSALAIVRRWAPADCAASPAAVTAASLPAQPVSGALAPKGIGRTLRARYLARHLRGGAPRRVAAVRPSVGGGLRVQPWSARARLAGHPGRRPGRVAAALPPLKPVADIATGIAAAPKAKLADKPVAVPAPKPLPTARPSGAADPAALLAPDRLVAEAAALPSIAAGLPSGSLLDLRLPTPFCANDETRIRNYAARIASSVGLKPEDDLRLFEADGTPTERLAPVMLAMSAVELGTLRAAPALVAAAIARLTAHSASAEAR